MIPKADNIAPKTEKITTTIREPRVQKGEKP